MESRFDDPRGDAKKLARGTHPDTSHEAAKSILAKTPWLQTWVLGLVTDRPGKTTNEYAAGVGNAMVRDPRTIGRRLPELEEMGYVRRGEAVCSITGRKAATWWPTGKKTGAV